MDEFVTDSCAAVTNYYIRQLCGGGTFYKNAQKQVVYSLYL